MNFRRMTIYAVSLLLYSAYFSGLALVFWDSIEALFKSFTLRHRLRKARRPAKSRGKFYLYINNFMLTTFPKRKAAYVFVGVEAFTFLLTFVLGMENFRLPMAFMIAVLISAMPFMIALSKLETNRNEASKEGISMLSELYRQYRMNNKNIYTAIEHTAKSEGDFPICKKYLFRLLLRLRNSGQPLETREYLDNFAFSIGTDWAKMLSVCMRLSIEKGVDVSEGIADISKQLAAAKRQASVRQRLNSESARMTVFLVPILYVGTVWAGCYYLETPFSDYLNNQFLTPEGFLMFIGIVFLFLFNLVLLRVIAGSRLDY